MEESIATVAFGVIDARLEPPAKPTLAHARRAAATRRSAAGNGPRPGCRCPSGGYLAMGDAAIGSRPGVPAMSRPAAVDVFVADAGTRPGLVAVRDLGRAGLAVGALDIDPGAPAFASRWCRRGRRGSGLPRRPRRLPRRGDRSVRLAPGEGPDPGARRLGRGAALPPRGDRARRRARARARVRARGRRGQGAYARRGREPRPARPPRGGGTRRRRRDRGDRRRRPAGRRQAGAIVGPGRVRRPPAGRHGGDGARPRPSPRSRGSSPRASTCSCRSGCPATARRSASSAPTGAPGRVSRSAPSARRRRSAATPCCG